MNKKIDSVVIHRDFLFRFLKRKFRYIRLDDIDDIVQISITKACLKIDGMQEKSSIKTWVTKIAYNEALDFIRRNKNSFYCISELNIEDGDINNVIDNFNCYNPIETFAYNHVSNKLIIDKLNILKSNNPSTYQTFIKYIILDDYKKVQEAENLPMGTVKSRINRARKIISKNLTADDVATFSL